MTLSHQRAITYRKKRRHMENPAHTRYEVPPGFSVPYEQLERDNGVTEYQKGPNNPESLEDIRRRARWGVDRTCYEMRDQQRDHEREKSISLAEWRAAVARGKRKCGKR